MIESIHSALAEVVATEQALAFLVVGLVVVFVLVGLCLTFIRSI